jgi:hypothetical protein
MATYEILSNVGVVLGRYVGECVTDTLNALAADAGYVSHTDYCDSVGIWEYDWTTDPARFRRGGITLLVTEVGESC